MAPHHSKKLEKLGNEIEFYDGVLEFFELLKEQTLTDDDFQKYQINVELYIVSTGLGRMIKGSKIFPYIDGIWGCEFIEQAAQPGYMDNEQAELISTEATLSQIGYVIDDTTKTRAIFEINKGVNKNLNIDVNAQIPTNIGGSRSTI